MDSTVPDPSVSETGTTEPLDLALALSTPHSLHRAVYARRAEYTRPHRIRVKVGTWNVAACPGTDKDLASWFVDGRGIDAKLASLDLEHNPAVNTQSSDTSVSQDPDSVRLLGGDKIGLYILGLQEVVNLNPVTQYVYADTNPTDKWRLALEAALPEGYGFVASEQMSGLLLLLYASPEVAPTIGNITTKVVGTGVGGWFGNKGAAVARIVLGETTRMVFVNSHLSSGSDPATLDRRCWDVKTILDRARFESVPLPGDDPEDAQEKIGEEDFIFWFGDLNFRLDDIPGDDIRHLLTLHTRGEYDLSKTKSKSEAADGEDVIFVNRTSESDDEQADRASAKSRSTDRSTSDDDSVSLPDPDDFDDPHGDPASLQATLDSLLPHDQLRRVMKQQKVFHDGWREAPITFLPSYKYDVGTVGLFDTSEKKRAPSWCDRILFRTKADREQYEARIREEAEARKRDAEMKARGIDHAGDDDEVLFDYDPDNDGDDSAPTGKPGLDYDEYDEGGDDAGPSPGAEDDGSDRAKLEVYASHQRITSSDHKPVVAIFTLSFDAVVPELKAEVHAEVVRELDRAENEGRPSITIVSEEQPSNDDSVDLGELRFLDKRTTYFTLANTGRVPATISFLERPSSAEGGSDFAQWLMTSLCSTELDEVSGEAVDLGNKATLEPGETVNAVIHAYVNTPFQARQLNDGRATLEDVLVLRVADGRDHFIPVRATWLPTCIGRSIDELIRVPDGGGIRSFATSLIASSEENNDSKHGKLTGLVPQDLAVHRSAPKELFKLIESLETLAGRALADEQMLGSYTIPKDQAFGWPFEDFVAGPHDHLLTEVIDVLDTDRPIADAFPPEANPCLRLETVADALLLFLRALTDGVISPTLWAKIEEQAPNIPALAGPTATTERPTTASEAQGDNDRGVVLDVLSHAPNHNICFVFLTTTLAQVVSELAPLPNHRAATAATAPLPNGSSAGRRKGGGSVSSIGGVIGQAARKSISFRRGVTLASGAPATQQNIDAEALVSVERRRAREHRVAAVFGEVVCRAAAATEEAAGGGSGGLKEKERRVLEGRRSAVVEFFLRRGREGGSG